MDKKVKVGGKKDAPEIEKTKSKEEKTENIFVMVVVMDPRSGLEKRVMTQAQLDLHLKHGWQVKS